MQIRKREHKDMIRMNIRSGAEPSRSGREKRKLSDSEYMLSHYNMKKKDRRDEYVDKNR